jgi:hypothetical protein
MSTITSPTIFLFAMSVAAGLVLVTVLMHYEALRLITLSLPYLRIQPRLRILVVILGIFAAHTVEIWVFGFTYWLLSGLPGLGAVSGYMTGHFFDYVYFSAVVYTSLGFGDIQPYESMRLIASVEGLVGLLMIGWSASFTYIMMEKLWGEHHGSRAGRNARKRGF